MDQQPNVPTHTLYAEQLLPLNLGYGLYEPDPGPGKSEVNIGDIGYILNGRFERIATIFAPGNGVDIPVEERHRAINTYGDIDGRVLSSKNARSVGVDGDAEANPGAFASVGMSFRLSGESTSGASLVKKYRATDEKAAFANVLKKRFKDCVESVFAFAIGEELSVAHLHDIILVTGRIMTGDWATIAFRHQSQDTSISFHIQTPVAGTSLSLWGKWSEEITFPRKIGPRRRGQIIPDGEEPPFDQCIFIETYRVYERRWYERLAQTLRIRQKSESKEDIKGAKRGEGGRDRSSTPGTESKSPSKTSGGKDDANASGHETVLTPYDVLAFRAFHCSDIMFTWVCIDEEDVKRLLPSSCTLDSILEADHSPESLIRGLTVVESVSESNKRGKVGRLDHTDRLEFQLAVDSYYHGKRVDAEQSSQAGLIASAQESSIYDASIIRNLTSTAIPLQYFKLLKNSNSSFVSSKIAHPTDDVTLKPSGPGRALGILYNLLGSDLQLSFDKWLRQDENGSDKNHELYSFLRKKVLSKEELKKLKAQYRASLMSRRTYLSLSDFFAPKDPSTLDVKHSLRCYVLEVSLWPLNVNNPLNLPRAVLSVEHSDVHKLWFDNLRRTSDPEQLDAFFIKNWDRILESLRESMSSFLAARYLVQMVALLWEKSENLDAKVTYCIIYYTDIAFNNPDIIEWSNLNTFFRQAFENRLQFPLAHITKLSKLLIRKAEYLPDLFTKQFPMPISREQSSISRMQSHRSLENLSTWNINEHLVLEFLANLSDSSNVYEHILCIRNLDPATERKLRDTALVNEPVIAYCHLSNEYKDGDRRRHSVNFGKAYAILASYAQTEGRDECLIARHLLAILREENPWLTTFEDNLFKKREVDPEIYDFNSEDR